MEEKISQSVIDKMSLIADRMQGYAQRYDENSVYAEVVKVGLTQLSNEIVKLVRPFNIQEVQGIDTSYSVQKCIEHAFVICDQIENIKFLNELKDDNFSIAFDNKWKDRIRTYIVTIKSILDSANIENERLKNSIFSKLNAFEKELDQTKTSLQKFEMAFVDITYAIGAGCKNLEPAYRLFYKVMKSFGKLTDIAEHPILPSPDDHKLLPPPDENESDQ